MKKLKTISPLNILILIAFIASCSFTIYKLDHHPTSVYNSNTKQITGIITKCQKNDTSYKITIKAKEKIIVNYYNDFNCTLGQTVSISGELKEPMPNTIFNLFNYQNYLLSDKINYTMTAKTIKVIKEPSKIYQIKNNLINYINTYKSKDYLNTFILGNNKDIDEEIINSYQINGISHLLAISGMHITLLSSIILFILNHLSKHKKFNYLIVIFILFFYAFLTNFTPSVIRATALFITFTIKKTFNLKIKTIFLLILIVTIYLFYNPYIIYNIGFLFSFIISFYLILFKELIKKFKNYFSKTFIVSFIAFLSSLPITINNFFEVNLLSPFINIFFVPLVSLVVYPFSLITLFIKPLDNILYFLIETMENLSLVFSQITIFQIILKHINIYGIIFYYLIITYVLYSLIKNKKHGIIILVILIFFHTNINHLSNNPFMTMIDVGQGDSILLNFPHNQGTILIDTGGELNFKNKVYDIVKNKTIPYLKSEGIKQIDYLILTHGDFDHSGLAPSLINNFKVKNIIFNKSNDNKLEKNIMKKAREKDIPYQKFSEKALKIKGYALNFLSGTKSSNENDDSLIIYTKINSQNILLMGDASETRESYILNTYKLPIVDILKVGHHGSKSSTSPEFINTVRPKISLISAGKNNLYGHPHKETLKRLEKSNTLITQIDGSVKLILKDRIIYTTAR